VPPVLSSRNAQTASQALSVRKASNFECRLHAGGGHDSSRRSLFSQKSSLTVGIAGLPDYPTGSQVTDQHLVKVGLRRVIAGNRLAVYSDLNIVSSWPLVLLNLSDYCEMRLMITRIFGLLLAVFLDETNIEPKLKPYWPSLTPYGTHGLAFCRPSEKTI
jgi:hypothetical protein